MDELQKTSFIKEAVERFGVTPVEVYETKEATFYPVLTIKCWILLLGGEYLLVQESKDPNGVLMGYDYGIPEKPDVPANFSMRFSCLSADNMKGFIQTYKNTNL